MVALEDGALLGSATMGPNRYGRGSHIATGSFMVEWACANDYHGIQFNAVVETHHGAVRRWQSLGFKILATVPEAFDSRTHGPVGLHVMYLPSRDLLSS